MGEVKIKSGNLALWDKQWLINVSGVIEYDKNVWASIIDVRDINTIYLSGDVTKLNNSIYRIGRFTEYPELGVVGIRSTSLGGVLDVTNYNFCLVSCSLFSMPTTRQDLVNEFMITLGSTPPTEFQPYFLNRPAHQVTNGQWVNIPTHHYVNNRWQGELTSQSPLKFKADGEMLDWRIEGATNPEPETIVYGFHVDPSVQDPSNAVTYLEDAVGMTSASMESTSFNAGSWADAFFIPNPCMVRYDGTVDYYLDPADYSKRADGTASDIADPNYAGNAMMEWGLIWYKFDTENLEEGEVNFYVSNKQVDDSYHCWCNYDADGNIIPHFYTAIYNGTGTDKLRSISGVQLTPTNGSGNATGQQEISRAMANNTTTKTEWYIDVLADRELINMLLVLIGKSLNVQAVFGRGLDSGDQATKEAYVTGTLDNKGLFWGVTDNGNNAVKVFGIENYWGCVWHRVAGMVSVHDATTNSNTVKIKLTHSTVDGTTVNGFNSTGNGYIDTGVEVAADVGVYIRKMKYFDKGYTPLLTTGGSPATYYSDYTYVNYVDTYYLQAGGCSENGLAAGPFYFVLRNWFSRSHWNLAACLSLKPRAKVPYNPHNGVGDWDETEQKYVVPVTVNGTTTNIFTDHQLMDGDSIDYATDQTAIPIAIGNNTLTVDTAVQPKSVFVKFEG